MPIFHILDNIDRQYIAVWTNVMQYKLVTFANDIPGMYT